MGPLPKGRRGAIDWDTPAVPQLEIAGRIDVDIPSRTGCAAAHEPLVAVPACGIDPTFGSVSDRIERRIAGGLGVIIRPIEFQRPAQTTALADLANGGRQRDGVVAGIIKHDAANRRLAFIDRDGSIVDRDTWSHIHDCQIERGRADSTVAVCGGDGDNLRVIRAVGRVVRPGPRAVLRADLLDRAERGGDLDDVGTRIGERARVGGRVALVDGHRGTVRRHVRGDVVDHEVERGLAGRAVRVGGRDRHGLRVIRAVGGGEGPATGLPRIVDVHVGQRAVVGVGRGICCSGTARTVVQRIVGPKP